MTMIIIWIVIIIMFVILEAITTQLVGIWFVVAAFIALIIGLVLDVAPWVQILIFVVSSAALLLATRPAVKRLLKDAPQHTNADRAVGETGIVTEEINNDTATGLVKVSGQVWSARSATGDIIPVDTKIVVDSIDGVKLIVEPHIGETEAPEASAEGTDGVEADAVADEENTET